MPKSFSLSSDTPEQIDVHGYDVRLVKKFDDWESGDKSIELRVPWINGAVLSTSEKGNSGGWGTITGMDNRCKLITHIFKIFIQNFLNS